MASSSPAQPAADPRATRRTRRHGWSRHSNRTFFLFIGPWFVLGFLGLTLIPLLYAAGLSFTNFDGISGRWHWIGWDNYNELIGDSDTWWGLSRSLIYMAVSVPLSIATALGLALLLNQKLRGIAVFRTIFYLPAVVPVVAAAIIFKAMFDQNSGIVNAIVNLFGGSAVGWLVDPWAFEVLIAMVLWGVGTGMVIFLAALQGIPSELREAAATDGANSRQTFLAVVLPLLTPVIFFQVVTGIIFSLQTVAQPLLLAPIPAANAGTGFAVATSIPRGNYLYMINVYAQIFNNQRWGYGAALLWLLIALMLVLTVGVLRSGRLWVYYEVDQTKG